MKDVPYKEMLDIAAKGLAGYGDLVWGFISELGGSKMIVEGEIVKVTVEKLSKEDV